MKRSIKSKRSKAAQNERYKLAAAFYNNLAVGFVIAGMIIPYIGYFHGNLPVGTLTGIYSGEISLDSPLGGRFLGFVFGAGVAVILAFLFRVLANQELDKME